MIQLHEGFQVYATALGTNKQDRILIIECGDGAKRDYRDPYEHVPGARVLIVVNNEHGKEELRSLFEQVGKTQLNKAGNLFSGTTYDKVRQYLTGQGYVKPPQGFAAQ